MINTPENIKTGDEVLAVIANAGGTIVARRAVILSTDSPDKLTVRATVFSNPGDGLAVRSIESLQYDETAEQKNSWHFGRATS